MARDDYSIEVDKIYGCWLWAARVRGDGYGITKRGGMAHRHVYTLEGGTIPEGLYLDHLCRRRRCVNPRHLEPVTQSENELRKAWRRRSRRKTCPLGHDISRDFTLTPEGGKLCRVCMTPKRF